MKTELFHCPFFLVQVVLAQVPARGMKVADGAGLQLFRGFSLNAAVGFLFIDTLKDGKMLGEKPVDHGDPFEYGTTTAFFFGVGYNF